MGDKEYILIAGLGNPGKIYMQNRHNLGFMIIDAFKQYWQLSEFKTSNNFSAEFITTALNGKHIILAKPNTFMNLSGLAVAKLKNYYKIAVANILIIHDDIDLTLGRIKCKIGGGHGGHNGLKSIDSSIGKDYWRLRIGVGRPIESAFVANYVLSNFSKEEKTITEDIKLRISASLSLLIESIINKDFDNINDKI